MSAMTIIAVILGAVGLGLGAYSVISVQSGAVKGEDGDDGDDGSNGLTGPPGTIGLIVGLWESLSVDLDNPDHNLANNYLVEVSDMKIYNTKYITLNQSAQHLNTRFHLIKSGWYRVNILMVLDVSVPAPILYVIKNGTYNVLFADRTCVSGYYHVNTEFYLPSNGSDYYEFSIQSGTATISTNQNYNQLGIEYIGDY